MESETQLLINNNKNELFEFVKLKNILYLESIETFTRVVCYNEQHFTICKCLSQVEEKLPDLNFFKIHKSFIINVGYIKNIRSNPVKMVVLQNGTELKIAERRYKDLIIFIKSKYVVLG
ncbi:MAG: LytR/AlgR family response regulator transcription factor [Bacteroidales bacterium]